MSRLLTALAISICIGYAPQAIAGTNDVADATDSASIYGAFLDKWTGAEKKPINISARADAPTADALKEFSDCAGIDHWPPVAPINDLAGLVGQLPYVRLVDPDKWRPRDPGKLIAQGHSVEAAVDAGFASGLTTFSAIAFDDAHTTAAFTFSFVCGGLCGSGRTVIFRHTPAGWVESETQCGNWISQNPGGKPDDFVQSEFASRDGLI